MPLPLCVRVEDQQSAKSLERDGWREIETLEIWQGQVERIDSARRAKVEDMSFCMDLARRAFTHDRLHKDGHEEADQQKVRFVMTAFNCPEYEIFVMPQAGFVIFRGDTISLIAVAEHKRKQGIGNLLVHAKEGIITAGTQSTNLPAKMLYRAVGMTKNRELRTFHKDDG